MCVQYVFELCVTSCVVSRRVSARAKENSTENSENFALQTEEMKGRNCLFSLHEIERRTFSKGSSRAEIASYEK